MSMMFGLSSFIFLKFFSIILSPEENAIREFERTLSEILCHYFKPIIFNLKSLLLISKSLKPSSQTDHLRAQPQVNVFGQRVEESLPALLFACFTLKMLYVSSGRDTVRMICLRGVNFACILTLAQSKRLLWYETAQSVIYLTKVNGFEL